MHGESIREKVKGDKVRSRKNRGRSGRLGAAGRRYKSLIEVMSCSCLVPLLLFSPVRPLSLLLRYF